MTPAALALCVPDGYTLDVSDDVVRRYLDATPLPGPVHGIGPAAGPVTAAWCPACLEPLTGWEYDSLYARRDDARFTLLTASGLHLGAMLTLDPCGHAFRVDRGQTLFEIREPAA